MLERCDGRFLCGSGCKFLCSLSCFQELGKFRVQSRWCSVEDLGSRMGVGCPVPPPYMPTLSDRRETLKLCLLFNILTGRVICPSCPITVKNSPYTTRCSNTLQLVVPRARSNQYKHSFLPSTIERWNGLDFDANGCNSLTSFKYPLLYYLITKYVKHVKYLLLLLVIVFVFFLCSVYGLRIYISYSIAIFLYDRCIAQICSHKKKTEVNQCNIIDYLPFGI